MNITRSAIAPLICATLLAVSAGGALAQDLAGTGTDIAAPAPTTGGDDFYGFSQLANIPGMGFMPGLITGEGVIDSKTPDLIMTVRGGVRFSPAYLGSSQGTVGPDAGFRFDYINFPGGFTVGSNQAIGFKEGFGLRGSARYLTRRDSNDYAEIRGLDNIPFSLETGLGLGYETRDYRVFGVMRYGIIGHNTWVGELGADAISYPIKGLTLALGPRIELGSNRFVNTYFGISPEESANSGLSAWDTEGGIYGAGMEVSARYQFNEQWGVEGLARWSHLMNSAGSSPVTSESEQYRIRFDLTRRISLDF